MKCQNALANLQKVSSLYELRRTSFDKQLAALIRDQRNQQSVIQVLYQEIDNLQQARVAIPVFNVRDSGSSYAVELLALSERRTSLDGQILSKRFELDNAQNMLEEIDRKKQKLLMDIMRLKQKLELVGERIKTEKKDIQRQKERRQDLDIEILGAFL